MKRLLITGASGFIGRHCLSALKNSDYEIFPSGHANQIKWASDNNVNWTYFDLTNLEQTRQVIYKLKPTHLLHLAWYTDPRSYVNSDINIDWLTASLELIKNFVECGGSRIVTAGTCFETYSDTLYGACKTSLGNITRIFGELSNISAAHGRIFYLYGPYEDERRVIPYVINQLLSGAPAACSHGEQIRDYLHVKDVADAFISILNSGVQGNIDIGSGHGLKLKDIFQIIENQINVKGLVKLGAVDTKLNDAEKIIAEIDKLTNEVCWKPYYSIEKGIAETIEWWKSYRIDH